MRFRSHPQWAAGLLLLFTACACAHAQSLNQCRGQGGATAYRGGACLPGERLVAVRDGVPDPAPVPMSAAAGHASKKAPSTRPAKRVRAYRGIAAARPKHRKSTIDPCTREKGARDDFQRRRGIHVTMDELSRWNHRVYDACK
jgi:hypothetical protein